MSEALRGHPLFQTHAAVLLFGLAGLFGKLLDLPAYHIVFGRTLFAALALGAFLVLTGRPERIRTRGDLCGLLTLGLLLAGHWIAFFHAIHISTVAIGVLTFATFPLFVTLLEPRLTGERLRSGDLVQAGAILAGVCLLVSGGDGGHAPARGAVWGTLSGLSFALLSLMNRHYVLRYSPLTLAWVQNATAAALLIVPVMLCGERAGPAALGQLAFLGIVCTALAHVLFIRGLRQIRARTASLIAGLEPVYAIALALILLHETPAPRTLAGGGIILACAALATRSTAVIR